MQEFLGSVTSIEYLTKDIVELRLQLVAPDRMVFKAGQFVQFKIGKDYRSYSIASTPESTNALTFLIKLEPTGVGSDYVRSLAVESEIPIRGPLGLFTVEDFSRDIVFVATSVGIAPFYSMVADMLARGYSKTATLVFGVRSEDNVFYYNEFHKLGKAHANFHFITMLTKPQRDWSGHVGRVTVYIDAQYETFEGALFYLCGSKQMVTDSRAILISHAHPMTEIKLEIFG